MRYTNTLMLILLTASTMAAGCIGNVQSYDTSPDMLHLGENIIINGVDFTVEKFELRDEFVGNGDLEIFYDKNNNKFLYIFMKAVNRGYEPLEIPSQYDVKLKYQGRSYRSEVNYHSEELEMYEYNWLEEGLVPPDHEKEGWILFQVPEDIDLSQVLVIVDFPHVSYTQTAIWDLTSQTTD